jgi:hypothetical protein
MPSNAFALLYALPCAAMWLQAAAEWAQAERLGVVRPSKEGVDPAYDAAKAAVEDADKDLQVSWAICLCACFGFAQS